jgi:plastocyanin
MLIALTLLVAACGSAAEPTALPMAEPTALPTVEPTSPPEPTVPPAPTNTPLAEVMITPSVAVADQDVVDGTVTIAEVVSDGPGWLVIHAQADGGPGPILGYSPVADGTNADVMVEIDASNATGTLYAMLHTDAGQEGTWEFPSGPDSPVVVGDQVVTPAFNITGGLAAPETAIVPSVAVSDQEIVDGAVTIAEVVSDGLGWLVIHAQADGGPGLILGYSPVADGNNADVMVEIDASNATGTLYAMLHTDAGQEGTWEFPGGPDTPVTVGDQVVTPAFTITGGLPAMEEAVTPSVTVADQGLVDGAVTIAEIVSDGPGWLVIHAQADGGPGPILGHSPVADGVNNNVVVQLDLAAATTTLYAMLHTDAGQVGTWEFPGGDDAPVRVGDQVVSPAFSLQVASGEAEVEMEDFQFNPGVLVIRAGTTVKWSNKDDVAHTATSDTDLWDSGSLAKGEDYSFTFTEPGVYPYYCIPHGAPGGVGMAATIIVLK